MITFYGYDNCDTCRKAKKALAAAGVEFKDVAITENPPSQKLLRDIIKSGDYKLSDLFNRSGVLYREMKLKGKLKDMSESQAIKLLADNGKLIKRPIVSDGKKHTVGYKPDVFDEAWL